MKVEFDIQHSRIMFYGLLWCYFIIKREIYI